MANTNNAIQCNIYYLLYGQSNFARSNWSTCGQSKCVFGPRAVYVRSRTDVPDVPVRDSDFEQEIHANLFKRRETFSSKKTFSLNFTFKLFLKEVRTDFISISLLKIFTIMTRKTEKQNK